MEHMVERLHKICKSNGQNLKKENEEKSKSEKRGCGGGEEEERPEIVEVGEHKSY